MGWIVLAIIVIVVVGWFVLTYNSLVGLRNRTQEAWSQIDVELKRRHDLIPNLVETVKGYAAHERGTFEAVTQARANAGSAGAADGLISAGGASPSPTRLAPNPTRNARHRRESRPDRWSRRRARG